MEYVPLPHAMHDVAPVAETNVPAEQLRHLLVPVSGAYVPASHSLVPFVPA